MFCVCFSSLLENKRACYYDFAEVGKAFLWLPQCQHMNESVKKSKCRYRLKVQTQIQKKREKMLQEKRNWAHIIKKQESIQKLKRKCNDAETETREAQNALQTLKAERDRAVERFVIIRD